MKMVTGLLIVMLALAQYPLWWGKSSWPEILEMRQQVAALQTNNQVLKNRNTVLEAEVSNLKKGLDAIEELARSELGMVRKDELFFHVIEYEDGKQTINHGAILTLATPHPSYWRFLDCNGGCERKNYDSKMVALGRAVFSGVLVTQTVKKKTEVLIRGKAK